MSRPQRDERFGEQGDREGVFFLLSRVLLQEFLLFGAFVLKPVFLLWEKKKRIH